jgi:hypothetical protein
MTNIERTARVICQVYPQWNEDFGSEYIRQQVSAASSGTSEEAPRGKDAEETEVAMIGATLLGVSSFILNALSIAQKLESRGDRIEAIRKEVSGWDHDRKEALIQALLKELD